MKRTTFKKVLSLFLALSLIMALFTGCGSKSESEVVTQEVADSIAEKVDADPTNISATISVGGWPSGDDAFNAAMAGFNEMYPNIKVELVFTDTTSHHQALQSALVAGTGAPDVAMVEGNYISQYRESDALMDLNLLGAAEYEKDFVGFKYNMAKSSDGKRLVAIPWDIGPMLYYYRTDVFAEVGLPTDPQEVADLMSTWDGVLKVAEAVSIPGQRWFLPSASYLYQWMFMNRDYFNDKLELKLEREGDIDCLNTALTIREKGLDMNVDMWSGEAYAAYAEGTCVSVAAGSWFSGFLKTDIDPDGTGHWGATVIPGSMPASNWGGSYLVIPNQSENKEAAWAFVKYMLASAKGQNDMFKAVDYFPAYKPAWEADPALYTSADPFFGGQSPNAIASDIASKVPVVNNTIMDVTAEGCIMSAFNAGAEAGETAEQIRERLGKDIEAATVELKAEQIQIFEDAGVWNN